MKRVEVTLTTRGYEMDAGFRVPPSTLARYMEHARWTAMADRGFEMRRHWPRGVIRAQQIEIAESVQFGTELVISLWVARVGKTSFDFGHEVRRRSDDVLVARAAVTAVALDDAGRPTPIGSGAAAVVEEAPVPSLPRPSPAPPDAWTRRIVVAPSDQDHLGHVNHARYIDFVEDTRAFAARARAYGDASDLASRDLARISVDYSEQARFGDELEMATWSLDEPRTHGFELREPGGGRVFCRARVGARA